MNSSGGVVFVPGVNDSKILQETFRLYGSVSLASFLVFCIARKTLQRQFNIRSWVNGMQCELAKDCEGFGCIDWVWKVLRYEDWQIREQCGLDAICLLRMFKFGMKLCALGIFNSVWLIPIYVSSDEELWRSQNTTASENLPTDPIARATVSALPPSSHRVIAPVLASYVVFGFTMYLIFREYAWFTEHRHAYLAERKPRNFAIYVSGIPLKYRTDARLTDLFRRIYGDNAVNGAEVFRRVPHLEKNVARRKRMVERMEHALVYAEKADTIRSRKQLVSAFNEDDMKELAQLNDQICSELQRFEREEQAEHPCSEARRRSYLSYFRSTFEVVEGQRRSAGFVYFSKRTARQGALRMEHSSEPYVLNTMGAPDPESLFERNIGLTDRQRNVGKLISVGLTFALRVIWTFPTAFIASVANLNKLKDSVPIVEKLIARSPWVVNAGAMGAPLLLLTFNGALPIILEFITHFELPISHPSLIAGTFPKLASFMIIQTFFVTTLSGSILEELGRIFTDSEDLLDFLGRALPGQSIFFMQVLLVKTFFGIPYELLRISPFVKAIIRRFLGPNLTPEESSRIYLKVIRPLCKPLWLLHAEVASANVLYFVVFFVYSATAPLVNWFLMFCFIALYPAWSYQIFCNYPVKPDTGGQIYIYFLYIVRISCIIGQLTLWAILVLKRYPHAIAWMLPLLLVNVVFNIYIRQEHETIARVLPSEECLVLDDDHRETYHDDFSFLENNTAYTQKVFQEQCPMLPRFWHASHHAKYNRIVEELQGKKETEDDDSKSEVPSEKEDTC